jgi:transcriptional regulator with XRE-family HTH domain
MHPLAATLGTNLQRARGRRNRTAAQVAEAIGMSLEDYERMERGLLFPSIEKFQALCSTLGAAADELLVDISPRLRIIKGGAADSEPPALKDPFRPRR